MVYRLIDQMRFSILFYISICVTLLLSSCGNSSSSGRSSQYEDFDTIIVEDVDDTPSSSAKSRNDDLTPDDVIRIGLKEIKSSLPMEMMDGMTITDAYLRGSYLVYRTECDDNIISVYDLSESADEAHSNIIDFLYTMASNDDGFALFLAALVEKHMGICYRYVSDESGDYFDIKIKYSELSNMF